MGKCYQSAIAMSLMIVLDIYGMEYISKLIGEYTKFALSYFEILNLLSTTINDFTVQEIKLSPF